MPAPSPLPLVLAGPIVRRVTATQVSVWIALSEPHAITLDLFDAQPSARPGAPTSLVNHPAKTAPLKFGPSLYIALVTAEPRTPLSPIKVYGYDLIFTDARGGTRKLSDLGLPLTYDPWTTPTFVTPPRDLEHLHLIHASCREPHGEGADALTILDAQLHAGAGKATTRPQQLIFTGDQIYNEDVAGPLLAGMVELADRLFGPRREPLPGLRGADELLPYQRHRYLATSFNLNARDHVANTRSHAIRFGELAAMYLMVWSDAAGRIPPLADVMGIVAPGSRFSFTHPEYDGHKRLVDDFRTGLPAVRRILANIATYMIFDDHEVTDDWYLDRAWAQHELAQHGRGRLVIRNALSAYAVFQAWGNDPDLFAAGAGRELLETIAERARAPSENKPLPPVERLEALLGMPPADPRLMWQGDQLALSPGAVRWSYRVSGEVHELVVLDTRTRRLMPVSGPVALLTRAELEGQLGIGPSELERITIVVSAAPLVPPGWFRGKGHELPTRDQYNSDLEDWNLHKQAWGDAFDAMFERRVAVVLGGDIHLGCAGVVSIDGQPGEAIACFVSSPLCNQHPGGPGKRRGALEVASRDPQVFHRWVEGGGKLFLAQDVHPEQGDPAVFDNHLGELTFRDVKPGSCVAVQWLWSTARKKTEYRVALQR